MVDKKVLIISHDLILANHLILILTELGNHEFYIIQNLEDATELFQFGGLDMVFIKSKKNNVRSLDSVFSTIKNAKIILMGGTSPKIKMQTKTLKNCEMHRIKLPFSSHEVKQIVLASIY